jgi:hypothetical protein
MLKNNEINLAGVAVDECASTCMSEQEIDCQSFTYCYSTARCYLNAHHPEDHLEIVTDHSLCDVYSREYCQLS